MRAWHVTLVCVGLMLVALAGCTHVVVDGTKVGSVIKLSQQGVFCKTWEGELLRGGMNGGSGAFSITPLHFTVNDPGLLVKVQHALDQQYEVEVRYVEFFGPMPCSSSSGSVFLTDIKRRE